MNSQHIVRLTHLTSHSHSVVHLTLDSCLYGPFLLTHKDVCAVPAELHILLCLGTEDLGIRMVNLILQDLINDHLLPEEYRMSTISQT